MKLVFLCLGSGPIQKAKVKNEATLPTACQLLTVYDSRQTTMIISNHKYKGVKILARTQV